MKRVKGVVLLHINLATQPARAEALPYRGQSNVSSD